jgi:hypothetical protein
MGVARHQTVTQTVNKSDGAISVNRPWSPGGVFCEVRASSTYKK